MLNVFRLLRGLIIKPKSGASTADEAGALEVLSSDNKLRYYNGTSTSPVLTEAHAATLTLKSIDADNNTITNLETDNLKAGVLNTSDTLADATDTQIPSALAVKTVADTLQTEIDTINEDIEDDVEGPASSTSNAIALYDGTTGKLLKNSSVTIAGTVVSGVTQLEATTLLQGGDVILAANTVGVDHASNDLNLTTTGTGSVSSEKDFKIKQAVIATEVADATTGSDATIDATNKSNIFLTSGTLVSVGYISGGVTGQKVTLTNATAQDVTIKVNLGTTNQIVGSTGDIVLPLNGSISFTYSTSAWCADGAFSSINQHIADTTDAHNASAISNVPSGNLSATDQQAVNNELQGDIDTINTSLTTVSDDLATHIADTSTHGVAGDLVGTTDTQQLDNKHLYYPTMEGATINESAIVSPIQSDVKKDTLANLTTYAATASNGQICFATDTKEMYQIVDGALVPVGSGSGGGTTNTDAFLTQTFDEAVIGDFTTDGADLVTNQALNGAQSARITHDSGSTQYLTQENIDVPAKFRGVNTTGYITLRSTATSGNVTMAVTDETNATTLQTLSLQTDSDTFTGTTNSGSSFISDISASDIAKLRPGMAVTGTNVPAGTIISIVSSTTITVSSTLTGTATNTLRFSALPKTLQFGFNVPDDCYSIGYTVNGLQEAGSPETYIDDIVFANYWMGASNQGQSQIIIDGTPYTITDLVPAKAVLGNSTFDVPVVTEWAAYTPTFGGVGTVTGITAKWRQVGESIEIDCRATLGTVAASTATVSLPNSYTTSSDIASYELIGKGGRSNTSNANVDYNILAGPSVNTLYFSLSNFSGTNSISPQNGSAIFATGDTISFFASVPIEGLSATDEITVSGTQQLLTESSDFIFKAGGNAGTAVTASVTDIPFIATSMTGSAGTWDGDQFTVTEDGLFTINANVFFTTAAARQIAVYKNGSIYKWISDSSSASVHNGSLTDYFVVGDVISIRSSVTATLSNNADIHILTISKAGSVSVVNTTSDQKIEIPTSELRLGTANGRGAVATAIVKFDVVEKIRGDAFTVTSNANDGTYVTMTKAGKLNVSASAIVASGAQLTITKNQTTLTSSAGVAGEMIGGGYMPTAGNYAQASGTTTVAVGDIIRVASSQNITSNTGSFLELHFQEQKISVSVSNTLPQFSESDSCIRLNTSNGYGSTGTKIRRFSNLEMNIGTDVEYIDSATDGASFTVREPGIYSITYTDYKDSSATSNYIGISRNASSLTTALNGLTASEILAMSDDRINTAAAIARTISVSTSIYLNEDDIIRPHTDGNPATNSILANFTISKVGKPNVTGVDVTPFINVPQPVSTIVSASGGTKSGGDTLVSNFTDLSTSSGDATITASRFTVNKNCKVTITWAYVSSAAGDRIDLYKNGVSGFVRYGTGTTASATASGSYVGSANAGDYFEFYGGSIAGSVTSISYSALIESPSDSILTPIETFSTDTAPLTYASSSQYTLSTLTDAPVGTFITYTYAASTNTRTQTTTAPTQTTADMNTNGIQIYTRAYNAASTAANPACVAIQIGKGLKGTALNLYKSAGKVNSGTIDTAIPASTSENGIGFKDYNEVTGILMIDAGVKKATANTSHNFIFVDDITTQSSGYLVINASKNPTLAGLGLNRIGARYTSTSGAAIGTSFALYTYETKEYDTNNAYSSGVYVVPETGYYSINSILYTASVAYTGTQGLALSVYKNGVEHARGARNIGGGTNVGSASISTTMKLTKGDTISIYALSNVATTSNTTTALSNFSIQKVSI